MSFQLTICIDNNEIGSCTQDTSISASNDDGLASTCGSENIVTSGGRHVNIKTL